MSDQKKSTSPSSHRLPDHWEQWPAFREALMLHLPPDVADSMRELGRALYEILDRVALYAPPGSWLVARLKATVGELRFARQCLEALADERAHTSFTPAELHLAGRCEAWAVAVDELAAEIETAVVASATEE
jgi:hypothetical protein